MIRTTEISSNHLANAFKIKISNKIKRKLGEMLKDTERAKGAEYGGRTKIDGSRGEPSNKAPTLRELKIDKKTSAQAGA